MTQVISSLSLREVVFLEGHDETQTTSRTKLQKFFVVANDVVTNHRLGCQ